MENLILSLSLKESYLDNFDIESVLSYAIGLIRNLGEEWPHFPPHLWSRFQKLIFPEGISYQKNCGFGTAKLGVIFSLNEAFLRDRTHQKSSLVPLSRISWNQLIRELQEWQQLQISFLSLNE